MRPLRRESTGLGLVDLSTVKTTDDHHRERDPDGQVLRQASWQRARDSQVLRRGLQPQAAPASVAMGIVEDGRRHLPCAFRNGQRLFMENEAMTLRRYRFQGTKN